MSRSSAPWSSVSEVTSTLRSRSRGLGKFTGFSSERRGFVGGLWRTEGLCAGDEGAHDDNSAKFSTPEKQEVGRNTWSRSELYGGDCVQLVRDTGV